MLKWISRNTTSSCIASLSLHSAGCGFFQNAYHVEPVVVSQRLGANKFTSPVWEPFRQTYRYAAWVSGTRCY